MIRYSVSRASILIALCVATACAKDGDKAALGGDTSRPMVASDTSVRAKDVKITPAQASRIHIADLTPTSFRSAVQTTGTVAFNGDRSTQVLAPVSGPITKILVNPGSVVRQGDALATVTSPDFAAALAAYWIMRALNKA